MLSAIALESSSVIQILYTGILVLIWLAVDRGVLVKRVLLVIYMY